MSETAKKNEVVYQPNGSRLNPPNPILPNPIPPKSIPPSRRHPPNRSTLR